MLKAKIIEKLKEITPEEREILDGQSEIDRNIYMQGSGNTVNSQKLLELGKLITVRKHTRFIDFPSIRTIMWSLFICCRVRPCISWMVKK